MKSLFVAFLVSASITASASELSPFMDCKGQNQYDETVSVKVLTSESNGISTSVATRLILTRKNINEQILVDGTILNDPDMLGNYQFISTDNRTRFLTSGTLYNVDSYFYRVNDMKCKVLKLIFTSNGNPR